MTWVQGRVVLVAALTAALLGTSMVVVSPVGADRAEAAVAQTRECTEEDKQATGRQALCINGAEKVGSRGREINKCLPQVNIVALPPGSELSRTACGSKPGFTPGERIAEARFVQYLDGRDRAAWGSLQGGAGAPATAIHSGAQWETATRTNPAKYSDVINYSPDYYADNKPAGNLMDLWELKVADATSAGGRRLTLALAQEEARQYVDTYQKQLAVGRPQSLWASMHQGVALGYRDNFTVPKQTCKDKDPQGNYRKKAIDHVFDVFDDADHPGALLVEKTVNEYNCSRDHEENHVPDKIEEPYSKGIPEPVVVIVAAGICLLLGCPDTTTVPEPRKEMQPAYVNPALFATDSTGTEYWQQHGPDLCAAIAAIERSRGSETPVSSLCDGASTFSALRSLTAFKDFIQQLDDVTLKGLVEALFDLFQQDGAGNVSNPARVNGDPHLVTLDGLNYDMQSVGEFDLVSVPDRAINVQARFAAAGTQSSVVAVAADWGDQKVEMRADGSLLLDGRALTIPVNKGITSSENPDSYLVNDNGTYRLAWAPEEDGEAPVVLSWQPINPNLASIGVDVPSGVPTVGLLGDNDGNSSNDLRTREGAAVDASNPVQIHDVYADSWRISDSTTEFTYAAGETTTTFTDRSFPKEIVTTGHFPVADQAAAQRACDAAGVAVGPSFQNCVLDVLVTRDNDFAAAFAGIADTSRTADDKVTDADGRLTETFSSTPVAANLRPLRSSTDDGYGDVAGPFSGTDQYRFHVPELPKHDQVTVAFDLIAVGQWDTADAVGIRIDSQPVAPLDLVDAIPGMLADGTPIRTKRISMTLDHYRELVGITLAGSGLTGAQRFAIDNVEVAARMVIPEKFSVQLQPGETTELRAPSLPAGAGVLERWGARDQYTVKLSHQDMLLDWLTRSSTVKWTLTNSTDGNVVAAGLSTNGNQRLRNLDGTYMLTVEGVGDTMPTSEAYSLNLLLTPEAERFSFELPGPVQLPADLPSPAVANGAGALETKLSTDLYTFSVKGKDRAITVNPTLCPQAGWRQRLSWTLLDSKGTAIDSGSCWTQTISGLSAGDYTLRVDPEYETTGKYRITVTQNGPTATFAPLPTEASNKKNQTVSFNGSDDAQTYECTLDAPSYAGPFTTCSSPATFSDLADGDHTIQVRAKDKDGNLGPAIKHIVTVDTAVPNMQITRKPPAQSNINGPVLEYSAEKRGMTYQCSLVPVGTAPSFEGCSGVSVYRDLKHGTYRFTVVGTDWVGNESTISYDFMVDLEPPVIDLVPPSNLTSTNAPQFTFTANEKATYECSLVLTSQPDAFTPCTSPKQYTGLTDGSQYRFLVKATDVAGQWSARGVTWTPYATPPSVTITSKPASSSSNAAPSFAFTSTMANPTFDCSLELASATAAFSSCTSPKTYSGKAAGTYKFTVKATDASGSWVSSTYQFAITAASSDAQAPTTPGTPTAAIAPAGASIGGDADTPKSGIPLRISWTGSTDNTGVAGYQLWYSTNGAAYVNAGNTSGTAVTMNVAPGSTNLRFQIKAYDAAGNTSAASTASTATTVALDQETAASTLLTYSGTWTSASAASYSGGTAKYASATSAAATFKAPSGTTQIAVVMATGPSAGRATIAVDGGTATTVDLYSSAAGYRTVALSTAALSATSAHTVVVKPAGTKNTSSSGTRIDLDAFITKK